jgi:hypothetical protein
MTPPGFVKQAFGSVAGTFRLASVVALLAAEVKALAGATNAAIEIPMPPAAANGSGLPAAERLKQVKQLFDQGLINKEDYDKKVKEILDSI